MLATFALFSKWFASCLNPPLPPLLPSPFPLPFSLFRSSLRYKSSKSFKTFFVLGKNALSGHLFTVSLQKDAGNGYKKASFDFKRRSLQTSLCPTCPRLLSRPHGLSWRLKCLDGTLFKLWWETGIVEVKVQLWITELQFMDPVIPLGGSYLFALSMKGVPLL